MVEKTKVAFTDERNIIITQKTNFNMILMIAKFVDSLIRNYQDDSSIYILVFITHYFLSDQSPKVI